MTSVIVTSEALNRKQLVRRSVPSTLNTCLASTHVFAGRGHRSDASALREIQLPIDEATDEWRNAFDSRKVVFSETADQEPFRLRQRCGVPSLKSLQLSHAACTHHHLSEMTQNRIQSEPVESFCPNRAFFR